MTRSRSTLAYETKTYGAAGSGLGAASAMMYLPGLPCGGQFSTPVNHREYSGRRFHRATASLRVAHGCPEVGRASACATMRSSEDERAPLWEDFVADTKRPTKAAHDGIDAFLGIAMAENASALFLSAHLLDKERRFADNCPGITSGARSARQPASHRQGAHAHDSADAARTRRATKDGAGCPSRTRGVFPCPVPVMPFRPGG